MLKFNSFIMAVLVLVFASSAQAAPIDPMSMTSGYTTDAGTVALWHFDSSLVDSSGNAFNLTLLNNGGYTPGRFNDGAFVNSGGFIGREVTGGGGVNYWNLGSSDLTIETWFNPNAATQASQAALVDAWTSQGIRLGYDPTGTKLYGIMNVPGVGVLDLTSASTIAPNAWHHAAVTREFASGAFKLYLDGVLEAQSLSLGGSSIGGSDGTFPWVALLAAGFGLPSLNGTIDETRISSVAREFTVVPEPSQMVMLGLGAFFLIYVSRKKRQALDWN